MIEKVVGNSDPKTPQNKTQTHTNLAHTTIPKAPCVLLLCFCVYVSFVCLLSVFFLCCLVVVFRFLCVFFVCSAFLKHF